MVITASRGGFLSLFAGAFFLLFLRDKRALLLPVIVALVLFLVPNPLKERMVGSADIYSFSRIDIWLSSLLIFLSSPFGIGAGNFQYHYYSRNFPVYEGVVHFGRRATTSHNEFLQVMVDQGVIGIVLFLFFIICFWIIFIKLYRREKNDTLLASFLASLVSIGVHSFFDSVFHAIPISMVAAAIAGAVLWDSRELESGWIRIQWGLRALILLVVMLLVALTARTFAGHLYHDKGSRALKENRYTESEKYLEISEKLDPGRPSLSELQAALEYRKFVSQKSIGSLKEAIARLDKAVGKNPMNFNYYVKRANLKRILMKSESPEGGPIIHPSEIWEDFVMAMEINPYSVSTLKRMADFLVASGKRDEAVSILRKAITIEPGFNRAWVMLGDMYADTDTRLALWMYRKALAHFKEFEKREMTPYERDIIMIDREKVEDRIRAHEQVKTK